ncbi:hypothetical protein IFR05_010307 [Cadophora sp. M221]|nr:hypothetical protein IFR05_010307 [Cadophora sp. M221]
MVDNRGDGFVSLKHGGGFILKKHLQRFNQHLHRHSNLPHAQMPSYWETCPVTKYPIEFKLLDDIVHDERYRIYLCPLLERPRQLSLDRDDPKEFKSIPRDFCILKSPGHVSWQTRDAQKEPKLEIFDTDVVRIPAIDLNEKFQSNHREWGGASYLNRYYHDGLTRVNVEKVFRDRFGLSILLSSESTADQWVPAVILYNVEIEQNTWEDRLAVIFDGNLELSQQSMKQRPKEYSQMLQPKVLGPLYLGLWRAKWAEQKERSSFLQGRSAIAKTLIPEPASFETQAEGSPAGKGRGRKRRAVLRQLRAGGAPLNQQKELCKSSTSDQDNVAGAVSVNPPVHRGRLRRRERRKNGGKHKESKTDANPNSTKENTITNSIQHSRNLSLDESKVWRFNNGEIGLEDQNNKIPITLSFAFDKSETDDTTTENSSTSAFERLRNSSPATEEAFKPMGGVPTLTIQAQHGFGGLTTPKLYHIISYCNQDSDRSGTPGLPNESVEIWGGDGDETKDVPEVEDYQIHIADLIDEVGVVDFKHWSANTFFSAIKADPISLIVSASPSSRPVVASGNQGQYWHKFAVLLHGFTHAGETLSRDNRWGYMDVDFLSSSSKRPRWRAAWRFDVFPIADKCECSLNNVEHDLNTCKHLYKEEEKVDENAWRSRYLQILSDPVTYAHKPYEFLRDLEKTLHKYHPPYVPSTKDKTSSSSSSSGDAEISPETDGVDGSEESSPDKVGEAAGPGKLGGDEGSEEDIKKQDTVKELTKEEQAEIDKQKSKNANRTYELGMCSLMALGVPKDIGKGIKLIKKSAELGCKRGKATAYAMASAYGVDLDVAEETLKIWLCETSIEGSRFALRDLGTLFPAIYEKHKAARRDAFDPQHQKTLSCKDDILPHFDLSNPSLLLKQIESFQANPDVESNEATKASSKSRNASLSVIAKSTKGTDTESPSTFIFGSLLHMAAIFGYIDAVEVLLDAGFDIDAQNGLPALRTPLLCAMNRGNAEIAKLLINRGASCQPLNMWPLGDMFCSTPTALHYLVNIDNESKMKELARLLVKNGADVNYKCDIEYLKSHTPTEIPELRGRSVTPLQWAVIHRKPQVVRILLTLGAKFAYEEYIRPSLKGKPEADDLQKGCLLLETPCTDLSILEMFFARARVSGLPIEFSQTPLGLLVSEDDGPERRLRLGFGDLDSIREALDLCLELQPGHEDVVMWSAVRHDHVEIVKYLLEDLSWELESQWRGLTSLHTAILYGRVELVRYLLDRGADATVRTSSRQLTCLHLLMLVPRHPLVDQEIFNCISNLGIEVDARENVDGLTAFHLAVRNQKLAMVKQFLDMGADPLIHVKDKLSLFSQGKGGYLQRTPSRAQIFTENLTILGEVLLQHSQDNFYDMPYVSDLLFLLLDRIPNHLSEENLTIDKGISLTLVHILSTLPPHTGEPHTYRRDTNSRSWDEPVPTPPPISTAPASLLQLVLNRSSASVINIRDYQGDTPLHYACASHQLHHIRTLLAAGADPTLVNNVGLNPLEVMTWSVIFLSGNTLLFHDPRKSWHPTIDFSPWSSGLQDKRRKHAASALSIAFSIFADLGLRVDERLQKLVLAWAFGRVGDEEEGYYGANGRWLEFVPVESARGVVGDKEPDSRYEENGEYDSEWSERVKRPYTWVSVKGPSKWRTMFGTEDWDRQNEVDFERQAL